jgi:PIN domain nuclease of toxin-antitoxin system
VRLLLDTHVWVWSLLEPNRLAAKVRRRLENGADSLWLSPISVWEACLLAERGRLQLDRPAAAWVDAALQAAPVRDAPLTRQVAVESRAVVIGHEDPADRFLAASALVHGLTLVTADRRLLAARAVPTLAAR